MGASGFYMADSGDFVACAKGMLWEGFHVASWHVFSAIVFA